ncbi:MAG: hypothetical protein GY822_17830 [Deltaproteobacteria bacterium]|nr:hypothetical protein [Deltaproteobacteria bacterium]
MNRFAANLADDSHLTWGTGTSHIGTGKAGEGDVVGEVARRCTHAVRRVLIAWRDHRARRIDEARYNHRAAVLTTN